MKPIRIEIRDVAGSEYCVVEEDGVRVHDAINTAIENGNVVLSFEGVSMLTSPFIRALIGDLYERFSQDQLRAALSLESISEDNAAVFRFVVEDIKLRQRDPQAYDRARERALQAV